jgi:site-specific DNA-methyltransferase (adenine-specific)
MTPYYSDDLVTIYHGDARDVMPTVEATLLVTDPPYGVGFDGKATKHTIHKGGGYTVEDDPGIGPAVVRGALGIVERGAVFTGNRGLHDYPKPRDIGCVYCPSGAGIGPWGFVLFHPVLFYGPRASNVLRPTSIQSFDTAGDDAKGHPCPKPLRWMTWAISLASKPGDVVLEPFAGSGTTLLAAKSMGLSAIGIEIEERYCEIAANRCSQEVLGLSA